MESNVQVDEQTSVNRNSNEQSNDESSSELLAGETCFDTYRKRSKASAKRCHKEARSRSSAAEMLDFLKWYSKKREKMEEAKVKVLKELKDEKTAFINQFFRPNLDQAGFSYKR